MALEYLVVLVARRLVKLFRYGRRYNMPEHHDNLGFKDKVHIVLRGPDGKIKDERKLQEETDENKQ